MESLVHVASTAHVGAKSRLSFLDLPLEIRDIIYAMILPNDEDIAVSRGHPLHVKYCVWAKDTIWTHRYHLPTPSMTSIMQLNRLIRHEAAKALYRRNIMLFPEKYFFDFIRYQDEEVVNSIQRIHLTTQLDTDNPKYKQQVYSIGAIRNIRQLKLSDGYFRDLIRKAWRLPVDLGPEGFMSKFLNLLKPFVEARDKHNAAGHDLGRFKIIIGNQLPDEVRDVVEDFLQEAKDSGFKDMVALATTVLRVI